MKAYRGTFKKKDGSSRDMFFARIKEMPDEFVSSKILGTGVPKKYPEGMETVFDLDAQEFRVFNWATLEGTVSQEKYDENDLE